MPRHHRPAFILLFGSRNIISNEEVPPVETTCPRCQQPTQIVAKTYRTWFTIFFLPIFPLSALRRFSQCSRCQAQFPVTLDEIRKGLASSEQGQNQQAIALYNSLRASPANSITLNQLMLMYAGMNEYSQAISAANDFPDALHNSEQCMSTLGRVYLAANQRELALQWFDHALARNPALGEANYYKAVTHLTATPPNYPAAAAAARLARNAAYPGAEALLKEAETKDRGE